MPTSPARALTWFLGLTVAAGLTAGALWFVSDRSGVSGEVGPARVPLIVDPGLRMEGSLRPGEHPKGDGIWALTRIDPPQASPTELRIAVHWDAGNRVHINSRIPLGSSTDARARVEIQRSSADGGLYSHGRGLEGVVRINRTTVPKDGEAPMLIELALSDYDGGSECKFDQRILLRVEDFR